MNLRDWNERYRSGETGGSRATPLLVEYASKLAPGTALDLACGAGRNSLYLAGLGWRVTAVDGAPAAVELLQQANPAIHTVVADLERYEFVIQPEGWDLVLSCYYFQRDLFQAIQAGTRPGGVAIAIVHIPRAAPGELRGFFEGWEILHYYEGASRDPEHKRPVAELVARRPRQ